MSGHHGLNRRRLPDERAAISHKFSIAGHEGYLHIGLYPDGSPGELFIKMSKQGSTVSGVMDGIALLTSLCLQYGVPLDKLVEKMTATRFEPSGVSTNPAIGIALSPLDYIFRYLELKFLNGKPENGDDFANGRPVAERESVLPEAEQPSFESVMNQALEIGSGLTAPKDPTEGMTNGKGEEEATHQDRKA